MPQVKARGSSRECADERNRERGRKERERPDINRMIGQVRVSGKPQNNRTRRVQICHAIHGETEIQIRKGLAKGHFYFKWPYFKCVAEPELDPEALDL